MFAQSQTQTQLEKQGKKGEKGIVSDIQTYYQSKILLTISYQDFCCVAITTAVTAIGDGSSDTLLIWMNDAGLTIIKIAFENARLFLYINMGWFFQM